MKIIILELNEVPHRVQVKYIGKTLRGKYNSDYVETLSLDEGQLSPWITWATVHRGVTNKIHGINDINQCTDEIDITYPTIFQKCFEKGLKVGLVNTMHSGSLAEKRIDKFKYFIPEAFAKDNFCIPKSLERFQEFNLLMSRKSSRTVSRKLPNLLNLIKVVFSYFRNTNRLRGIRKVVFQLIAEIFFPFLKVRRRTIQSDLIFDLFMSLQNIHKPDLSVFFTNHVASNMHRFWEATFPLDYQKQVSSKKWIKTYKNEIPEAMKTSREYINIIKDYIDKRDDTQLWIMSSMGQRRIENYEPQEFYWDIVDLDAFVSSCLKREVKVEPLPQMIPIYSFKSTSIIIDEFARFLNNSKNIKLRARTSSTIAFSINNQLGHFIINGKSFIPKGFLKKKIDEKTSSAAYHTPEGFLLRYGPNLESIKIKSYFKNKYLKTDKIKSIIESTLNIK